MLDFLRRAATARRAVPREGAGGRTRERAYRIRISGYPERELMADYARHSRECIY